MHSRDKQFDCVHFAGTIVLGAAVHAGFDFQYTFPHLRTVGGIRLDNSYQVVELDLTGIESVTNDIEISFDIDNSLTTIRLPDLTSANSLSLTNVINLQTLEVDLAAVGSYSCSNSNCDALFTTLNPTPEASHFV